MMEGELEQSNEHGGPSSIENGEALFQEIVSLQGELTENLQSLKRRWSLLAEFDPKGIFRFAKPIRRNMHILTYGQTPGYKAD